MTKLEPNSEDGGTGYLLTLQRQLEKPRALNAALGSRLADELVTHFGAKDQVRCRDGRWKRRFPGRNGCCPRWPKESSPPGCCRCGKPG